jgi:hypothetical protein
LRRNSRTVSLSSFASAMDMRARDGSRGGRLRLEDMRAAPYYGPALYISHYRGFVMGSFQKKLPIHASSPKLARNFLQGGE